MGFDPCLQVVGDADLLLAWSLHQIDPGVLVSVEPVVGTEGTAVSVTRSVFDGGDPLVTFRADPGFLHLPRR